MLTLAWGAYSVSSKDRMLEKVICIIGVIAMMSVLIWGHE